MSDQINTNPINTNINVREICDKKKGRKSDDIRKHFVIQGTLLKCIYNECGKTFSPKTSVTALKYHVLNKHEQIENLKTKSVDIINNMENDIVSENDVYEKFAVAFAKNSLSHLLIEDVYFRIALDAIKNLKSINLSKKKLRELILIKSDKVNDDIY
jgi:hypothetical protein